MTNNNTPSFKGTVFLDRDGVINKDCSQHIRSAAQWIPIANSIQAIAKLSKNNYRVVVVTNQSGIARNYFSEQDLQEMHAKMNNLVKAQQGTIHGIYYCPHAPTDHCSCRKPLPGLFHQAIADLNIDKQHRYVIGDSRRDLLAGIAVGCQPILVRTGKGEKTAQQIVQEPLANHASVLIYDDLACAVDQLMAMAM